MYDRLYKSSFIFAAILHVVLVFFLLVKFNNSHAVASNLAGNFINAVVINETNNRPVLPRQEEMATKILQPQPKDPIKKQPMTEQVKLALRKNLYIEKAKEIAELKKEKQMQQKIIAKEKNLQQLFQDQIIAERKQITGDQAGVGIGASQSAGEIDEYKARIIQAISAQWIIPEGVDDNVVGWILVNLAPGGKVISVEVLTSSGNEVLDRSAQTAVLKASPLPIPEDPKLFDNFRTFKLKMNPKGIVTN